MKILVENTESYEWEIPDELIQLAKEKGFQEIIDKYFDPDNISVEEASDPYYEFKKILEN